jgi:hypothetical protein
MYELRQKYQKEWKEQNFKDQEPVMEVSSTLLGTNLDPVVGNLDRFG